ncbi:MAG: hypothetical protein J0I06_05390 [Planctomycetes bacterium]|nr:hypothetical protein [Planctomycetota bacterium]
MPQPEVDRDPFFIGWLKMPRAYARFLAPVTFALVAALTIGGAVLAWAQRSPGPGTWDDAATTFTGIVYTEPYAMIRVPPVEPGGAPRTVLLVEEGKFGAKERARAHDGQPVRVSGTLIARDSRLMLELAAGEDGLRAAELPEAEQAALRRTPPRGHGPVTLRGEIVDSKCYLGAMKPGGGRTHKGCAVLCLKGGVPPLFAARDSGTLYLLTNARGRPLDPSLFDRVGDDVRLEGVSEDWDDLPVLKVSSR